MKILLQNFKTGQLRVDDVPAPATRPGGVIVRNHHSLVSVGTERTTASFAKKSIVGKARSRPDLVRQVLSKARSEGILKTYRSVMARLEEFSPIGYSSAGEVLEVGQHVDHVLPGDVVACAGTGYANHAEIIYVPKNLVAKVPSGVGTRQATFSSIGAVALQGIRRAELTQGERVVVIGLGLVGQLTVQLLHAYGFPVMGVDPDRSRVNLAKAHGISQIGVIGEDDVIALGTSFSEGFGADAVIITAASSDSSPIKLAGDLLRERGRVSVVGAVGMDVPRRRYYANELDLRISRSYGPGRYDPSYEEHGLDYPLPYARWTEQRNMQEFLRLASVGKLDIEALITRSLPIDKSPEGYSDALKSTPGKSNLGVLIEYPGSIEPPVRTLPIKGVISPVASTHSDEIHLGLIGTGSFMKGTIIPALSDLPDVRVTAIASRNGHASKDLAERQGAAYVTTNYQELLEDDSIDLIIAATRHNLNAEIAVAALAAGKHVHVEKPLAINREQLAAVMKQAAVSQSILHVGFNRRFAPDSTAVRDHFVGRSTPLIIHARVNAGLVPTDHWVHDPIEGGGRLMGEMCHFVDLQQFFAESPPIAVYASRLPSTGNMVRGDENAVVTLEFGDGSRGVILYSALGSPKMPKEYVEVLGGGKSARIDDFSTVDIFSNSNRKKSRHRRDKGHRNQFRQLINAIRAGGPAPIPFEQIALSSLATICVIESLAMGHRVTCKLDQLNDNHILPDRQATDHV